MSLLPRHQSVQVPTSAAEGAAAGEEMVVEERESRAFTTPALKAQMESEAVVLHQEAMGLLL